MEHIFDEFSISYMKIDASTDAEDRDNIISAFSRGTINCLLSMRILDEGVDVPAIERAIIVASSSNTGQFIQRRGRLLRKSKGKYVAEIYDILVLASNDYNLGTMNNLEKNIMEKELKRALIFSKAANNKSDCISTINTIALKYNLTYIDMED
jgi:superfamily II DNA or RNA helicase